MKPHIKPKGEEFLIFSNKEAVTKYPPIYICLNMNSVIAMLNRMKVNDKSVL